MKLSKKKIIFFIVSIIILILITTILSKLEINYNYNYKIDNIHIEETFNKDLGIYTYNINNIYTFNIYGEYSTKRGMATDVTIEDNCIYLNGNLDFYNYCQEDKKNYFIISAYNSKLIDTLNNIDLYNVVDNAYYIWDYDGFLYIKNNKVVKIDIFENEVYSPSLIKQIGDNLFIPNYDESYYFSSYILLDMNTATYKTINLKTDINFDIAYLSTTDDSVNIYDKKNQKVFSIKLSSGLQDIKQGISYSENQLNEFLNKNNYFHIDDNVLTYKIDDFEISIENFYVNKIIYEDKKSVIFLSKDNVYYYEVGKNIEKILSYKELEFNYNNLIFVY